MEKNIGLNELIYDYYESRILFGHYKYGDPLPSISQICDIFQVGRNTVRAAFSRLKEKGYILSEERKASIVVYQGTLEDFEMCIRDSRKAGDWRRLLAGRKRGKPSCADRGIIKKNR